MGSLDKLSFEKNNTKEIMKSFIITISVKILLWMLLFENSFVLMGGDIMLISFQTQLGEETG